MLAVFTLAILMGATLLFLVQPMAGKLILPLVGGTPQVWNACMLFFQGLLLGGYLYAHWVGQLRSPRKQVVVHLIVMGAASALLPIGLPAGDWWQPDPAGSPALAVLVVLAAALGAPAFVMCSASPLLQRWFAHTHHRAANDPYFLYAASNTGSMAALLGYPFLIEPNVTLAHQRLGWSIGYGVFLMLIVACGAIVWRSARGTDQSASVDSCAPAPAARRDWAANKERLRWIALSFVPAGVMMGATQFITTDIAAVPLLWVVPLAVYLLTYIAAFSAWGPATARVSAWVLPIVIAIVGAISIMGLRHPLWLAIGSHIGLVFLIGAVCHGRLAAERPEPSRLTEFYVLLSVGGVLAGVFCAMWAPEIFMTVREYPLLIAAGCALTPLSRKRREHRLSKSTIGGTGARRSRMTIIRGTGLVLAWALAVLMVPIYVVLMLGLWGLDAIPASIRYPLCWIVPMCICLISARAPMRLAVAAFMILSIRGVDEELRETRLLNVRTFFGVHRVVGTREGDLIFHRLYHGRTEHNRQRHPPPFDLEPLAYFTRAGPVGDVFRALGAREPAASRIAIIGLGAGAIAAYGTPGMTMHFYEIDPEVIRIARNPRFFTYLENCQAQVETVLGDARLTIARAPDASYDMVAMDAFSSDSLPAHLITREALALYRAKLAPGGVIMVNISNIYLDLEPVVARLAEDAGMLARVRDDPPGSFPDEERLLGRLPSKFAVLADREADLGAIAADPRWRPARTIERIRLWTDDYSDVLSVLKRH